MNRKITCGNAGGKVTWRRAPDIAPSARRHGVSDDDMRHALRYPLRVADLDDSLTMFGGPTTRMPQNSSTDSPVAAQKSWARGSAGRSSKTCFITQSP